MSPYYRSSVFKDVMDKVGRNPMFSLKQVENRLKLVVRGVDSMEKAYSILKKLR